MSEEDVGRVKALFAAFAARDAESAARLFHPECEIRPAIVGGPEGVVYRGPKGNARFWADIDAAWTEFRIETEEFRDLDGKILVLGRAMASAPGSGIALDQAAAWIAEVSEGRIVRFRSFTSHRQALTAAGLQE
jgi:ketosteroid isomerase-like protein